MTETGSGSEGAAPQAPGTGTAEGAAGGNRPKVSVIMPAYNTARFVAETIESILGQTWQDFEFLIYDDASTDGTRAICEAFARRDARIRVLGDVQNRGSIRGSNALIAVARGDYIARIDCDDVALPDRLERQVAFLDAHPEVAVVGGWYERMDEDGFPIGVLKGPLTDAGIRKRHLEGSCCINGPTATMRRAAVVAVGGYPEGFELADDYALWLRLAEVGAMANLPAVVLRYRLRAGAQSETRRERQKDAALRACNAARARQGLAGAVEVYEHWRPGPDRASQLDFALMYGWQAWGHGYRPTWRRYALRALRLGPLDRRAWQLLIFGGLRRPAGG